MTDDEWSPRRGEGKNEMRAGYRKIKRSWFGGRMALLIAGMFVAGCGGQQAAPQLSIFPQNPAGGRVVSAGDTINFSGEVTNAANRAPRFVVVKPAGEPRFDPAQPLTTGGNVFHGKIASETGRYVAPKALPDVLSSTGATFNENVAILDADTYNELANTRYNEVLGNVRGCNGVAACIQNKIQQLTQSLGGDANRYPTLAVQDIIDADAAGRDTPIGQEHLNDAIGRMTDKLPANRKQVVSYAIVHKVVADPQAVDVSVRDRMRLGDNIKVLGDQSLAIWNPVTRDFDNRTLGDVLRAQTTPAGIAAIVGRLKLSILNPLDGALGNLNPNDFGVYVAPLALRTDATGKLITTGNPAQDIVVFESQANLNLKPQAQITVRVVTSGSSADAPVSITITKKEKK